MEFTCHLPVETILRVDENKIIIGEEKAISQVLVPANFVLNSMQIEDKVESHTTTCNFLSTEEKQESVDAAVNAESISIKNKKSKMSMVIREWPLQTNGNLIPDPKVESQMNFNQPISCNIQELPIDETFFLQFDYKTRNKLKTKQRRLDPFYRSQERIRQRTVMRIKRQDPRFRAAEREKGRYRMRIKRLDPAFRSQERERQRERMKIKRSDPYFREKEREQQKTRLYEKRLDPDFLEKERTQNQFRMYIKKQNDNLHSTIYSEKNKSKCENADVRLATENKTFKSNTPTNLCDYPNELKTTQAVFPENVNATILSIKSREAAIEAFHFKKQRILNLNFYNSSNEQWSAQNELYSKTITHLKNDEGK